MRVKGEGEGCQYMGVGSEGEVKGVSIWGSRVRVR